MIYKSLIISLSVCIIYSIGLGLIPPHFHRLGATSHQENVVRVETVVFKSRVAPNLIVGSSLSQCLLPEFLGDQFDSLALAGIGAPTGIKLLEFQNSKPRRLFVESNYLFNDLDPELIDYFGSQPMAWLRSWLPLLRQSNQPVTLLFSWYQSWHPVSSRVVNQRVKRLGIAAFKATAQKPLNQDRIKLALDRTYDSLDRLRHMGVEIVLVEFPISSDLSPEPGFRQTKEWVRGKFPESEWKWIRFPLKVLPDRKLASVFDTSNFFDSISHRFPKSLLIRLQRVEWMVVKTNDQ